MPLAGPADRRPTLYHCPNSRSSAVRILLEELDAPHELVVLDMTKDEQRGADYRAVNPMGKVPALVDDGAVVTELAAISIYLCELFPDAGLAPGIGDPLRGPYLRWLVFYGSSFEPAVMDKAMQRDPGPRQSSPYGDYDTVIVTLGGALEAAPHLLGAEFSAADILFGSALSHLIGVGLIEAGEPLHAYAARFDARPSVTRIRASDAELAQAQSGAA